MKNILVIFAGITLLSCSSTSNFNKRKYTHGKMENLPTSGKLETKEESKIIPDDEISVKFQHPDTKGNISDKELSLSVNESIIDIKESEIDQELGYFEKEIFPEPITHIEEKLDSPAPTKAEKKLIRKAKRKEKRDIERKKIAKLSKAILLIMLSSTIAIAGISFISRGLFYILIWGVFPASLFSFFFFGIIILLMMYLF